MEVKEILMNSPLFRGLNEQDLEDFMQTSGASVSKLQKNEIIFDMQEKPEKMFVLLQGSIAICKDTLSGKRIVMTNIDEVGDIFGEVYLFLRKESYDFYTIALTSDTILLNIPKNIYIEHSDKPYYHCLVRNILEILSQKAYNLNQKLSIVTSGSLRQKISKLLLAAMDQNQTVDLGMRREQMADYLGVARPSLSRELANMQSDGLIDIKGQIVEVIDVETLELEI